MYIYYVKEKDEYKEIARFDTWWNLYVHWPEIARWFQKGTPRRKYIEFDELGVVYRYENSE